MGRRSGAIDFPGRNAAHDQRRVTRRRRPFHASRPAGKMAGSGGGKHATPVRGTVNGLRRGTGLETRAEASSSIVGYDECGLLQSGLPVSGGFVCGADLVGVWGARASFFCSAAMMASSSGTAGVI